jgi:hypothetical protein
MSSNALYYFLVSGLKKFNLMNQTFDFQIYASYKLKFITNQFILFL